MPRLLRVSLVVDGCTRHARSQQVQKTLMFPTTGRFAEEVIGSVSSNPCGPSFGATVHRRAEVAGAGLRGKASRPTH